MDIPYTSQAHPETGLVNGKIGLWIFLASEVMLFGALFASYIMLRVGAESWPAGAAILDVPLAFVNTLVLITSSVTMVMAWASLLRRRLDAYRRFMLGTVALGLVFLVIKAVEYSDKVAHGHVPAESNFMGMYFTLTGLHALHVLGGMCVNAWLALPGSRLWRTDPQWLTHRVENAGLFWHFVDLVWIFLFPVLYLL
jgi:cytochrome c oxidase subunit III